MLIAYVHGFQSSSRALKAQILESYFKDHNTNISFVSLDFPDTPKEAFESLKDFCKPYPKDELCLVGSSMGGFFSTLLSIEFGFKAALINPCLHPHNFCKDLLGLQYNPETSTYFTLTKDMLLYLKKQDELLVNYDPTRIKIYLQKNDEVLDYTVALNFFSSCQKLVQEGGSHGFDNFEAVVPDILSFFKNSHI